MQIRHEIINKTHAKEFSFEPYRIKITRGAIEAFLNGTRIVCHHVKGVVVPRKQLIDDDMYHDRPADELMIVSQSEHASLHNKSREHGTMYGKTHSEETRKKMSLAKKGKKRKPFTEEHRKKISLARKRNCLS